MNAEARRCIYGRCEGSRRFHHCGVYFFLTPSCARYYVVTSLLSVAKAKSRNTATLFPDKLTIPRITLILALPSN
jgi:hypothetical protein